MKRENRWGCKKEIQFSEINKTENKGKNTAFICDRLKDRSKAIRK